MSPRIWAWSPRIIPVLIAAGAALSCPIPAAALCAGDPATVSPIPASEPNGVVFVGTAVETRTNDYSALFRVEEVWLGGTLPEWQAVIGNIPETGDVWVEDAVQWKVGTRYLVTTHRRGSMLLGGSACSGNQPYSAALARYRPSDVSAPTPAARPSMWTWRPLVRSTWPLLLGPLVAIGMIGLWVFWVRRPRRVPNPPPGRRLMDE
jgi:hypothetical protein